MLSHGYIYEFDDKNWSNLLKYYFIIKFVSVPVKIGQNYLNTTISVFYYMLFWKNILYYNISRFIISMNH